MNLQILKHIFFFHSQCLLSDYLSPPKQMFQEVFHSALGGDDIPKGSALHTPLLAYHFSFRQASSESSLK